MEGIRNSSIQERILQKSSLILGGGEMGKRIRDFEWATTSLGAITDWPQSLRITINLLLQSPAPMVILWGEEGLTLYNDAYIGFAGGRHPALLGASCELIWPEAADFIRNVKNKCLEGEAISYKNLPYRVYRNGTAEDIWMDLDCSPVLDDIGSPAGALILNVETTNYVQIAQDLKKSEERLKRIVDGTNEGIWDYSLETKTAFWNQRVYEIFGFRTEEVPNPGFEFTRTRIHSEDIARVQAAWESTIKTGQLYEVEYRFKHKAGHYIHLLVKGKPVYNEQGEIKLISGISIDITARKQAQEALQESEERFRSMAEAAGILIAHTDKEGNAVYFNQEWLKLTGRKMEELINYDWADLFHPDDREGFVKAYMQAIENKAVLRREFRLMNQQGNYCWQLAVVSPRYGQNGTFAGYISSCIDITERKQAEEELAQKNVQLIRINNDLDNFIYTASHDLRSPVLNLEGLLAALNKRLSTLLTPQISLLLDKMDFSVEKLHKTIKDLTEITKAQKDLEEGIEEVTFKEILEDIKTGIIEDIQEAAPLIWEDFQVTAIPYSRGNLRSILYNLFTNALKYRAADRQAEITVSTYTEGQFVVLSVQDNGLGISEHQLPKIFTMFKRLHTHVEGTGIGLYIIKRIIENKGGKIEVSSENGKGSLFKVYLLSQE